MTAMTKTINKHDEDLNQLLSNDPEPRWVFVFYAAMMIVYGFSSVAIAWTAK